MKMTAVQSSMVAHHGYDAATKTMALTFRDGKTYHYHHVPQAAYDSLVSAKSLGQHFYQHVKPRFKGVVR